MRGANEFDLLNIDEIDEEIRIRDELLDHMVGWLYTSILHDEIRQLKERKKYLQEHVNKDLFDQLIDKRKQPV